MSSVEHPCGEITLPIQDTSVPGSFTRELLALIEDHLLNGPIGDDEDWKKFEPLFKWREPMTDYYGQDLISLLTGLGGRLHIDHRLPPELIQMWDEFGKLDGGLRWKYAEAFVRSLGPYVPSYGEE
jgi:hypothetical protein